MSHLALYRAYRPKDFNEVVGQQHIVRTIKNQVKKNRLAHAYVFTGPRGTGKTSIARIVAKAVNCTNPNPDGNPCNHCESCLAVANGNHPDVIELDGASNNSVEDIRDIRERTKYATSLSTYKVYIIDEVHMLSTGAFNALLKTLEEPPEHVIFMLATTEVHKVPQTILSRVQRFDLLQIPTIEMSQHLDRILKTESVSFESGVPDLVSTLAAGGLRDALSILDQAISYHEESITLEDIHYLNGSISANALTNLVEAVYTSNVENISKYVDDLYMNGKLPMRIVDGLLKLLRDILLAVKLKQPHSSNLHELMPERLILDYIYRLNQIGNDLKFATDSELLLEVSLLDLALNEKDTQQNIEAEIVTNATKPMVAAEVLVQYDETIKKLEQKLKVLEEEVKNVRLIKSYPQSVSNNSPQRSSHLSRETETTIDYLENPVENEFNHPLIKQDLLLEDVLNKASLVDKSNISQFLATANPFVNLADKEVVMLLKDGEVVAASKDGFVLVYEYETVVEKLLKTENRQRALKIVSDLMARPYGFIALPKSFWLEERTSYVVQTKEGKSPKLRTYQQPVEKVVIKEKKENNTPSQFQELETLYGDVLEIKE